MVTMEMRRPAEGVAESELFGHVGHGRTRGPIVSAVSN
jgi:hypothetical protein